MQLNIGTYFLCLFLNNLKNHKASNSSATVFKHYQYYKHIYNYLFLFLFVVFLVCVPSEIFAADLVGKEDPPDVLNQVNIVFTEACAKWSGALHNLAKNLFMSLLTISAVWRFGNLILSGNNDFQAVAVEIIKFVVTFGFFYWLIDQNSYIVEILRNSFDQLADNVIASGGISTTFKFNSPDGIIVTAFEIGFRVIKSLGWITSPFSSLIITILMLILIALMVLVAVKVLMKMIEVNFLIYAGIVALGFAGHETTKEWAIAYYKTLIAKFVELFALKLVVIAGMVTIYDTANKFHSVKSPGIGDSVILLMVGLVLVTVSDSLPAMISSLFGGGGSSSGQLGQLGRNMAMLGAATVAGAVAAKKGTDHLAGRLNSSKPQNEEGIGNRGGSASVGGVAQDGVSNPQAKSFKDTGDDKKEGSEAGGSSSEGSSKADMANTITGGAVSYSGGSSGSIGKFAGKLLGGDGQLLTRGAKALGSTTIKGLDAMFGKDDKKPISAADGVALGVASLIKGVGKATSFTAKATSNFITGGKSRSFGIAEGISKIAGGIANSKFGKDFTAGYTESAKKADDLIDSPLHKANK